MKRDEETDTDGDRDLQLEGHRVEDETRRPVAASRTMMSPLMTTMPIASGQVTWPTTLNARNELMPSPAAKANGRPRDETEEDRHEPGGECGDSTDLTEVEDIAQHVGLARQDDRVQDHDVDHRDERHQSATHLGTEGGASGGDLEVAVETVHHSTLSSIAVHFPPSTR